MAVAIYRGFNLQSAANSTEIWQVRIKNHVLTGNLAAVKKSIDWFCDTASIIDPKEFESIAKNVKFRPELKSNSMASLSKTIPVKLMSGIAFLMAV